MKYIHYKSKINRNLLIINHRSLFKKCLYSILSKKKFAIGATYGFYFGHSQVWLKFGERYYTIKLYEITNNFKNIKQKLNNTKSTKSYK